MFAEQKDTILETIRLAKEREEARIAYEAENGPKKWGVYLPEENTLNEYLLTVEREVVEVLEVLMLLGRNEDKRKEGLTPEENYLDLQQERYHHHPDQLAAVYYLTGKRPLHKFLEDGLEYLGVGL